MDIRINTVHITLASEHLLLIGLIVWALLPRLRQLLKKNK
jgi:hypothetical protein